MWALLNGVCNWSAGTNVGFLQAQQIPFGITEIFPDSKVHGAKMGPTWVLPAPDGPHVVPMNLAIRVVFLWTIARDNTKLGLSLNYMQYEVC